MYSFCGFSIVLLGQSPYSIKILNIMETVSTTMEVMDNGGVCEIPDEDYLKWDDVGDIGNITESSEIHHEATIQKRSLVRPKNTMKIECCWSIRNMYRQGKTVIVTREMRKYNLEILKWN